MRTIASTTTRLVRPPDRTAEPDADNGYSIATPDEGRVLFDYQARKLMGMSGEEFLRRWDAGEFAAIADTPGHRHLMTLAGLIAFARQEP